MRQFILFFISSVIFLKVTAQQEQIDSLKKEVAVSDNDTLNMIMFGKISDAYAELYPDSSYEYALKMLALARKLDYKLEEVYALNEIGYAQLNMGNYPRSLQSVFTAIAIAEDKKSEKKLLSPRFAVMDEFSDRTLSPEYQRKAALSRILQYTGIVYLNSGNNEKSKQYYYASIPLAEETKNYPLLSTTYSTLGRTYLALKQPDSALICLQLAYDNATKVNYNRYIGSILLNIGRVYALKENKDSALVYFKRGVMESEEHGYYRGVVASNLAIADIFKHNEQPDSSLFYIKSGLPTAYFLNSPDLLLRSYTALADFYKTKGNNDSTVKYQSLIIKINDSLFNTKQIQQFQNIDFDQQQREQEKEASEKAYQVRLRFYGLLTGLAIFLLLAIILWRNSLQRKKANILLSKQKDQLESALAELTATQNQLIQSEKMASLGELTAGIAHEIQNPLNFVNNFSEVNKELIGEMRNEMDAGNLDEAKNIAKDIEDNEQKIIFHGKRADAIVKSMLQHSRASSGKKEITNINSLVDEYLRLSYHGLRAKDKSFNAKFETNFDNNTGEINIISQDIGRVILNLINNAFYSVTEKKKQIVEGYDPTVIVSTKRIGQKVEIKIRDNGNGVPQKILDKIFQPFFTTKPTGEGTGLGLSLSYDIITNGHGGELKVNTKEGEYAEFVIILPT